MEKTSLPLLLKKLIAFIQAHSNLTSRSRVRAWKDITAPEMRAFIGLIFNMSLIQKPTYHGIIKIALSGLHTLEKFETVSNCCLDFFMQMTMQQTCPEKTHVMIHSKNFDWCLIC